MKENQQIEADVFPPPLPHLPESAQYLLRPEKLEEFTCAMSDILCWMAGFKAGGGMYEPSSIESLRNLNDALKSIQSGHAKSNQSHE